MNVTFAELFERDMLMLFMIFARSYFSTLTGYFFMYKLLPCKLNLGGLAALALFHPLSDMVKISDFYGTAFHYSMTVFNFAWIIFVIAFIFEGKFWRKCIVYWFFFESLHIISQMIARVPGFLYFESRGYYDGWFEMLSFIEASAVLTLIYNGIVFLLYIPLGFLCLGIWQKLLLEKFNPFHALFVALPLGLKYSFSSVIHPSMGSIFFGITYALVGDLALSYQVLSLFGVTVCLSVSIVLFVYFILQEKRTAVEAELLETRRAMELEQLRYQDIERQGEELEKIRHDFNNQLATIIYLFRVGEDTAAYEMIKGLSEEIKRTDERPYCHIPAINAALSENFRICEGLNLTFTAELILPPVLDIEQMHLCRILENLIDDAINVCDPKASAPAIRLNSMISGDYLFIKAVTTAAKNQKTASDILSDLAERYDGGYSTEYKNGTFTATMSLLAVKSFQ